MRYVATPDATGWGVMDLKTCEMVRGSVTRRMGRGEATRTAQWLEHSGEDRAEWNRGERQLRERKPSPVLSRIVYRDNRLAWTDPGHYNAMPCPVTVEGR